MQQGRSVISGANVRCGTGLFLIGAAFSGRGSTGHLNRPGGRRFAFGGPVAKGVICERRHYWFGLCVLPAD